MDQLRSTVSHIIGDIGNEGEPITNLLVLLSSEPEVSLLRPPAIDKGFLMGILSIVSVWTV